MQLEKLTEIQLVVLIRPCQINRRTFSLQSYCTGWDLVFDVFIVEFDSNWTAWL